VDLPVQPTVLESGEWTWPLLQETHQDRGVGKVEAIASCCFAQIIVEYSRSSYWSLSKVDFETEVGLIIVLHDIVHEFGEIT